MDQHARTFAGKWARAVRDHGDQPFLFFHGDDGTTTAWSYAEFDDRVDRVASTLLAAGVGAGSAVHIVLRNSPVFIAAWLAVARVGAWMVPADPASTARDIAAQVRRTHPRVALVASERAGIYHEGSQGRVPAIVELSETAIDLDDGAAIVGPARVAPEVDVCPGQRLAVMFTSGTTAEPKGVVLSQACYATVSEEMARAAGLRAEHRWIVTLPLFHANAQYYCFAPAIEVGASVALTASFSASRWTAQAQMLGATHASLFAAPIRMILARCPVDAPRLRLEHVWFAQSLGEQHHREFGELVGTRPRQLYGMTETCAVVTADRNEPALHDVIGPPVDGRQVRVVVTGTDRDADVGTPGEIWVHGRPGVDLLVEYLDDPEVTSRSFVHDSDGGSWFRTGDLASADADGVLRFVGRVDDVIKVAGENVSLTETEAALAQAPGVLEVAVVARTDDVRDQVPVAYVVARDVSAPPQPEELAAWARHHLAPAARPREWHLIDKLPRTSVGKVRRFHI